MKERLHEQLDDRLRTLPHDFREPPVAFAALSFLGPLLLVLIAVIAGQSAGVLYTVAAGVFVFAVCGFVVTSFRKFRVQHAEKERLAEERARLRRSRRPSAAPSSRETRRAS